MLSLERKITLSGRELCSLMRRHRVTIRELSKRMGITQKRIRHRRAVGLVGLMVHDWRQAIVGEFTAHDRAQLQQVLREREEWCLIH
jgi:hypothetical protein